MRKYNIVMFSDNLHLGYNMELMRGVSNAIKKSGNHLIIAPVITTDTTNSNIPEYYKYITSIISLLDADGYIIPAGSLTNTSKNESTLDYMLSHLDNRKILCLEDDIPGLASIVKDNKTGMRELIEHLLTHHHYKHYGIIAGRKDSKGSNERLSVLTEVLDKARMEYHIAHGNFKGECDDVINGLLDQYPDTDILICLNDQLALNAYSVIEKRGMQPGRDIGVTGFDDIPNAALMDPPLSTVRMNSYHLGYLAGEEILNIITGQPRKTYRVSSHFIERCSSGNTYLPTHEQFIQLITKDPFPIREITTAIMDNCILTQSKEMYIMINELVKISNDLIHERPHASSIYIIRDILNDLDTNNISYNSFYNTISNYYQCLMTCFPKNYKLLAEAYHISNCFTYQFNSSHFYRENTSLLEHEHIFDIVNETSMNEQNTTKAYKEIFKHIDLIGVNYTGLYLFEDVVRAESDISKANLYFRCELYNHITQVHENRLCDIFGILKTLGQRHPHTYLLTGLADNDKYSGFMLSEAPINQTYNIYYITLELSLAIKYLRLFKKQNELIKLLNQHNISLQHDATFDEMTGLLNRRGFINQSAEAIKEHENANAYLYYIDLDHLKYINDNYGHAEGDFAIKEVANILRDNFRDSDIIARMGGDEFVSLAIMTKDVHELISARLEGAFKALNAAHVKDYDIYASIGYTHFVCDKDIDIGERLKEADRELYLVKLAHHANRKN